MTTPQPSASILSDNWEYLKTLISIFTGFVTAFLAEPVKVYFTNRAKKDNMKKALYGEIISIYNSLFAFLISTEERMIKV